MTFRYKKGGADALRLTTAERTAKTWPDGELLYDTDTDTLYVGDGSTSGGVAVGSGGGGTWGSITGTLSDQTDLQDALDDKLDVGSTTADIDPSTDRNYVTDAEAVVIGNTSGTNTGDQNLSGLVPYTGATADVDLGAFKIDAKSFLIDSTIPIKTLGTLNEIVIGTAAGFGIGSGAYSANMIGTSAGVSATNAHDSNFFGNSAGSNAPNASASNFFGNAAGANATNAASSNFFGDGAGYNAVSATASNFFGANTGFGASSAYGSNFFGNNAGSDATNANDSNFFGSDAGNNAVNAAGSNFFGNGAGLNASLAYSSNFFGDGSGYSAANADNSNFFGAGAGFSATNAANSIFIGVSAGDSDSVNNSTAGFWSIAIGPHSGTGGFSNSMSFGRGVINSAATQMNFGNVLYGTGIYNSDTKTATPIAGGKIGIGVNAPTATLDVNGDLKLGVSGTIFQKLLSATATLDFPSISSNSYSDLTMTVTGATVGSSVHLGAPAAFESNLTSCGWVSAADTVTVRLHNGSGGAINPASATWRATVINF